MRRWLATGCAAVLVASSAHAQNKPEPIKREQSKLWLEDVPGIANPMVSYFYLGWSPDYSLERFYAQAFSRGQHLPRLQVNLSLATAGFVWIRDSEIDEKYVKRWPFFKDRDVTIGREHSGGSSGVITVPFRSVDTDCFAFMIRNVAIGTSGSGGSPPSVDGFYCAAPGTPLDAALTQAVLGSIRVTSDLSKIRTALVPTSKLPTTPPHIASATPVAATPRPGMLGWTAPVGTRFVGQNGYFQISAIDGTTAVTVNAVNRSARWVAGLFVPRPGARIDTSKLTALHPLAVGKETQFEEVMGDDRWEYNVRVSALETLTVGGKIYQAFVVVMRERSVSPAQGGLERTRTLWISPDAGGILRYRTVHHSGPTAPAFNFEIVEIVGPS